MKLQRILLRWAPAGLGLEYLEEDGTLAVLHKDLPAKEDVTSAKQVRALAKQLCCEHPELLGKKRKALTAQLARLYEMDMDSPEVLQKKVASALATALINGSLARVMADEADEDDMLVEPLSSRACSRRISRSCPRPCSRPSSDPSTEAVRKQTAILLTSALHDGRLEQALAKKARKDSKDTMPPLSSAASRSSSKLSAGDSSSEAMRKQTASALTSALHDGRLEQALANNARQAHVAALRNEAAAALRSAAIDGTLDAVLRETVTRKESQDTTPLLPSMSSKPSSKPCSSDASSEDLREQTASLLTSALRDGRLQQAVVNTTREAAMPPLSSASPKASSNDSSSEALRMQTATLLTSSLHDGRLVQALTKKTRKDSKDTMPPLSSVAASRSSSKLSASDSSSEASRTNTSSLLSASLSDGRLEQALEKKTRKGSKDTMPPLSSVSSRTSTKASSSDSPSEALWKKTAPLLTSSMSDGCLEHAHANSMQMPEEGRPQSQAGQRKLLVHKTCPDSSEFNQSSGETMMPLFIS